MRRMLDSDPNEQVVRVPTRGQVSMMSCINTGLYTKFNVHVQPLTLVPISGCRISSSEVSRRTLKRRTDDISRVRNIASGGESSAQLKAEIRSLTTDEREELLQQAQLPVVIPTDHALAMKADLALPWNKLRIIRR